jgi:hypothetical protein
MPPDKAAKKPQKSRKKAASGAAQPSNRDAPLGWVNNHVN